MTTTVTLIDRSLLLDNLREIPTWVGDEGALTDMYCPRGGYGDTCVAITFGTPGELGTFMFQLGVDVTSYYRDEESTGYSELGHIANQLAELASSLRVETKTVGIVAYFPGFRFET